MTAPTPPPGATIGWYRTHGVTANDVATARARDKAAREELQAGIRELLVWSSDALGRIVGLGQMLSHLEAGGLLSHAAQEVEARTSHVEAAVAELTPIVERLREAATNAAPIDRHELETTAQEALNHLSGPGDLSSPDAAGEGEVRPRLRVVAADRLDAEAQQAKPSTHGGIAL